MNGNNCEVFIYEWLEWNNVPKGTMSQDQVHDLKWYSFETWNIYNSTKVHGFYRRFLNWSTISFWRFSRSDLNGATWRNSENWQFRQPFIVPFIDVDRALFQAEIVFSSGLFDNSPMVAWIQFLNRLSRAYHSNGDWARALTNADILQIKEQLWRACLSRLTLMCISSSEGLIFGWGEGRVWLVPTTFENSATNSPATFWGLLGSPLMCQQTQSRSHLYLLFRGTK